jgi:dTDP-4-dehydrorhamnose reductase
VQKQRVFIIGASGFLGMYAVESATASDTYDVVCGSRGSHTASHVAIDIADASSVDRAFHEQQPDLVLLLSAIADIDRCERSPAEAFAINARGAENVANACARSNARLLFTSTAAVFDGKQNGYTEEDPVSPVSVYGRTKVWAELSVKALVPSACILRFALVLGRSRNPAAPGMVDSMVAKLKAGETLYLSTREKRNPLHAACLSNLMLRLLADPQAAGLYHAGASDSVSRYELGRRLATRVNVSSDLVQPKDDPIPGRAPRGEDHFLLTGKLQNLYDLEIESCDQVIERCFA